MARSRLIRSRFRRLVEIGMRQRALLAEAGLWLVLVRIALVVILFPVIARQLGEFVPPSDPRARIARSRAKDAALTAEIGWAVTRAARYVPFRAVCLPQAMAAPLMLASRGIASVMQQLRVRSS
jgi:hypothetical protein